MKCQNYVNLWKGIDSRDDLRKFLPIEWEIINFVGFKEARERSRPTANVCRNITPAQALCAVADDVDKPCEDLKKALDDKIWDHRFFDD